MAYREEWDRDGAAQGVGGIGALRMAVLFGAGAVALALLLAPVAESQVERYIFASNGPGVDMMATGTVGRGETRSYTIRRSVLQPSPNAVCIIRPNGTRSGDC